MMVFTEVLGIVSVLSFKILTKSGHPIQTPSLTTITFAESTYMCAQNQPKTQNNEPN